MIIIHCLKNNYILPPSLVDIFKEQMYLPAKFLKKLLSNTLRSSSSTLALMFLSVFSPMVMSKEPPTTSDAAFSYIHTEKNILNRAYTQ